ncbi:glutamate--tRNA ligase [Anaplasma bovis]|uniref:glutamate--tRNA ligase n=1 Tax=Anaplasma bovis TaxID=186733 RepID=UPI002FF1AAF1
MRVVTRFAPSPTGELHLGGARTALFNWLFARQNGGKFLLRIEDTDKSRSSEALTESIINDLSWLGLTHDDELVKQSTRIDRHVEIAAQLVKSGKAYFCYCSESEIANQRMVSEASGEQYRHVCPWRDAHHVQHETPGVVRLKNLQDGKISFLDGVYGEISVDSSQIDDMVILRSNGTPTYLLAVVVDDHDMGITHVIRGSDHITNTHKQIMLAQSLGWESPKFFHIPLIHDENGNKLSKRNNVPGIYRYKELGFLPEAICNYILRMSWSYMDKEIVSMEEALDLFSVDNIGTSPACLDSKKLLFLNHHYMRQMKTSDMLDMVLPFLKKELKNDVLELEEYKITRLSLGINRMLERTKTLDGLARCLLFYVENVPISTDEEALKFIQSNKILLKDILHAISAVKDWRRDALSSTVKGLSDLRGTKVSDIFQMLRAAIVGRFVAPNICEVMEILGEEECIKRLNFHVAE